MRFAASSVALVAACTFAPQNGNGGGGGGGDAGGDAPALHADGATDAAVLDAPSGPSVVQENQDTKDNGTSLSVSFAHAPVAGDVLMMVGGESNGNQTAVSGAGSAWTRAAGSWQHTHLELWYAVATGSDTQVTLTDMDGDGPMFMTISEWSGIAAPSPLDVAASGDGSAGITARPGPVNTNGSDVVVLGLASDSGSDWEAIAGLVPVAAIANGYLIGAWYELENAPCDCNPGEVSPGKWDGAVAAFKQR